MLISYHPSHTLSIAISEFELRSIKPYLLQKSGNPLCTFSPFVGSFLDKKKRYSRDLVESLVLSALTISYNETSRRVSTEAGIKAVAITEWRQLKEAYQRYEQREKKTSSSSRGVLSADSTGVKTSSQEGAGNRQLKG